MPEILRGKDIAPARGKLGVLMPGIGAVASTLLTGLFSARKGLARPVGSLTQMGKIRLGKRTDRRFELIKDFIGLTDLADMVFGGWDCFPDSAYLAARKAKVLTPEHIEAVREELEAIEPMPAVFDRKFVQNLDGRHVKKGATKMDLAGMLMKDIDAFRTQHRTSRLVMCWTASTEAYREARRVHASVKNFEAGLKTSSPDISPSQIYAYAALKMGIPYINGAPHITTDCPAFLELAGENRVPVCGKDFKTGQTLMKTILAPGFAARLLGISGWFSTNILGNRDGEVLDNPESFRSKEISKLGVLDTILRPDLYPELYGDFYHKVKINYYPPRGDNKESWDNIDIYGWMDYPMQIKVNFLCRDSILAAPVVLDLILFTDLAARAKMGGIQEWLSFYFKSPMVREGLYAENDLFVQRIKLLNTLRYLMREELIHHTGLDYYYDLEETRPSPRRVTASKRSSKTSKG
ncbi:MAG: inositol-3-phosphate synthase [Candidatus Aminicenantes bacterium]|nr:inositol-3-phosphate synthase [Candidatus Aminicenantes bacterium]